MKVPITLAQQTQHSQHTILSSWCMCLMNNNNNNSNILLCSQLTQRRVVCTCLFCYPYHCLHRCVVHLIQCPFTVVIHSMHAVFILIFPSFFLFLLLLSATATSTHMHTSSNCFGAQRRASACEFCVFCQTFFCWNLRRFLCGFWSTLDGFRCISLFPCPNSFGCWFLELRKSRCYRHQKKFFWLE